MKREIEIKLKAIEDTIAAKKETCCKNLAETIRVLKRQHPEEFDEIYHRIIDLLAKYNVDCTAYLKELSK